MSELDASLDLFPVPCPPPATLEEAWMDEALALAERGRGRAAPNPVVGCVLVRDGAVVARGWHRAFGGPHAEVDALRGLEDARGCTAVVSLEPCCHHGKTPPCSQALIEAGVRRVVIGCVDPNPRVSGGGVAQLQAAGIEVLVGVREAACRRKNGPFFLNRRGRAYATAKWAMSLDGKIATASGSSQWISSEPSRRLVQHLRDQVDAILVGGETARRDDPRLTCRLPGGQSPQRVVLSRSADIPLDGRLVQSAREVPVLIFCREVPEARARALEQAGCELVRCQGAGAIPPAQVLEELLRRDLGEVLIEGGGGVLGAFADAGCIDRWLVFVAPKIVGGAGPSPVAGQGVTTIDRAHAVADWTWRRSGADQLGIGYRRDNWEETPAC